MLKFRESSERARSTTWLLMTSLRRQVGSSIGYLRQARSLYLERIDFNHLCHIRQCLQILEKCNILFCFQKLIQQDRGLQIFSAVWPCFVIVQWSAVITRSNIVRYYINNYRNWGRISIRCWTLKRHAIPRPHERVIGVFCEYLWENLPHYNGTALYVVITRSDISTRRADITEPLWVWAIPLLTTAESNHVHRVAANAVTTNAFSLTEHVRL